MQRLHPAAGAEVERPVDGLPDRQLGQRGGGRADPEHVLDADPPAAAVEAGSQVRDHPPVVVAVAVRPDVDAGAYLLVGPRQHAGGDQRCDQPGQGSFHIGDRHPRLQRPQPGQRRQPARRPPARAGPGPSRPAAARSAPGRRAVPRHVHGVVRGGECRAQPATSSSRASNPSSAALTPRSVGAPGLARLHAVSRQAGPDARGESGGPARGHPQDRHHLSAGRAVAQPRPAPRARGAGSRRRSRLRIPGRARPHPLGLGGEPHPRSPGQWDKLVAETRSWPGTVLISHEMFSGASAEDARTAVAAFAPARSPSS